MTKWIDRNGVWHKRTWRHRLVVFLLDLGCRHPQGIVCDHRHFEYDSWLKGWHEGYVTGSLKGTVIPRDVAKAEQWRLLNHPDCRWHQYTEDDAEGPGMAGKCVPAIQVIRSLNLLAALAEPVPAARTPEPRP